MPSVLSRYAHRRMTELAPRSVLGRITLFLLVLDLVLYVAQKLVALVSTAAAARSGLSGWVSFLTFVLVVLGSILVFRWMRDKLLWRLRNRLLVTYVFIGVIPVLLIAIIAFGAGYLFVGQFATYLATSDIHSELRALEAANATIASEYAHNLSAGEKRAALPALRDPRSESRWAERQVTAWYGDQAVLLQGGPGAAALPRPAWAKEDFRSVTFDSKGVYLRVSNTVTAAGKPLTIVSSEPLDAARLQEITSHFGEITITDIGARADKREQDQSQQGGFRISRQEPGQRPVRITVNDESAPLEQAAAGVHMPKVTAGSLPPPAATLDREFSFISLFQVTDWSDGRSHTEGLIVHSRLSALYGRLFRTLGQLTQVIIYAIAGTAVFFAIIELFALFIGLGLTRTITKSVAELYKGTQHVNRGDFSYRIPVRSKDQLAALETSFNSMNDSLQRLMAEQKEKQRMENELAIAQEVQSQLFPKQTTQMESLEVFGVCQPARTVSGDYYDFLPLGPERLGIAVGDISGKGISAALLMATVHSAVRAYEFGRMPAMTGHLVAAGGSATHVLEMTSGAPPDNDFSPANVLTVLNRQLYHSTPTEKYATLFLSVYDARTRTLNFSNAGHLPPIIIHKDRSIRRLDTPGLVVGLFDAQGYAEESVSLAPGDVFLAYSDGVTEPENEFGEFGEERLIEIVRDHRHLPLADIGALVTTAVKEWIGGGEQPDDITIVLARPR